MSKNNMVLAEIDQTINTSREILYSEVGSVPKGTLWLLQAIASTAIRRGELSESDLNNPEKLSQILLNHTSHLEEIAPELIAATELTTEYLGYVHHTADGIEIDHHTPPNGHPAVVENQLFVWFGDMVEESLKATELLPQAEIVMVVGNQGVGKGRLVDYLVDQQGYSVVSMSEIVRGVVAAWGLNQEETINKIIGGRVFKEYFGADILVWLGVQNLLAAGKTKIVIDGPRVMEEARAALEMGGKLIGVIADKDPNIDREIRRGRIAGRATADPLRAGDVAKFDEREAIEAKMINEILALIDPKQVLVNRDGSDLSTELENLI